MSIKRYDGQAAMMRSGMNEDERRREREAAEEEGERKQERDESRDEGENYATPN